MKNKKINQYNLCRGGHLHTRKIQVRVAAQYSLTCKIGRYKKIIQIIRVLKYVLSIFWAGV